MKHVLLSFVLLILVVAPARAADPAEIVFIFQKQKDPTKTQTDADKVAAALSTEIGVPVRATVPGDYSASVAALVAKKADFAYVSSLPFLLARRDGGATLLLAEQRTDARGVARTDYDSVFVVPVDSPLKDVSDLISQSKTLRFCFTSPTSTSGYIMPYYRFVKEGLLKPGQDVRDVFSQTSFGGGYTQALEQLLAGRADVAAVSDYVMEGAKVDTYLKPEQRDKLRILGRTPGVPTHLICARDGLSDDLKNKVKAALLKLSREQPELLGNVYGATTFTETDENKHVKAAVDAIEYIRLPIEGLAK